MAEVELINAEDVPAVNIPVAQIKEMRLNLTRKLAVLLQVTEENDDLTPGRTKFSHTNHVEHTNFTCQLKCTRCVGATKANVRCSKRVCMGIPLCWMHSLSYLNLRVGQTRLRHNNVRLTFGGLFACNRRGVQNTVVFPAHTVICPYMGELVTQENLNDRYGEGNDYFAAYSITAAEGEGVHQRTEDGACQRSMMSMANRANNIETSNVRFRWIWIDLNDPNAGVCGVLKTTRNILNGQEILVRPEQNYEIENPNLQTHFTKPFKPAAVACKHR